MQHLLLLRVQADKNANIPYPDGFHDVRRFVPGGTSMTVVARMFDKNSVTGQPNTARQCCIQLPTDTVPLPSNCSPDPNCSPRCEAPDVASNPCLILFLCQYELVLKQVDLKRENTQTVRGMLSSDSCRQLYTSA